MSSRSMELDKTIRNKNESFSLERKESVLMRLLQLIIITVIAAATRIIVFFTLKI